MSLLLERAERMFRDGELLKLVRECGHDISHWRALEPGVRILVAHALAISGDLDVARVLAELSQGSRTSAPIRSRAEWILALDRWRRGDVQTARELAQKAVQTANQGNDTEWAAWAQLFHFRLKAEEDAEAALSSGLRDVRRAVARSGSAQAVTYLHICVAVIEGQRGRTDEARRHLNIAESLL